MIILRFVIKELSTFTQCMHDKFSRSIPLQSNHWKIQKMLRGNPTYPLDDLQTKSSAREAFSHKTIIGISLDPWKILNSGSVARNKSIQPPHCYSWSRSSSDGRRNGRLRDGALSFISGWFDEGDWDAASSCTLSCNAGNGSNIEMHFLYSTII